jgi:hypothetical protein
MFDLRRIAALMACALALGGAGPTVAGCGGDDPPAATSSAPASSSTTTTEKADDGKTGGTPDTHTDK